MVLVLILISQKNNIYRQFLYIKPSESLKYVVKAIEYSILVISIESLQYLVLSVLEGTAR